MRIIASFARRELKYHLPVNCSTIPSRVHIIAKHVINCCFHLKPSLTRAPAGLPFINLPIRSQSMRLKTLDIHSKLSKLCAHDAMHISAMFSMMDPNQRDYGTALTQPHSHSRKKTDHNPRNRASCSSLGPALSGSLSGLS